MSAESTADVLVLGAGPAGLGCAGRLAAHGIQVRLVDREGAGGQLANASAVYGIPGITSGTTGADAAAVLSQSALSDTVSWEFDNVESILHNADTRRWEAKGGFGTYDGRILVVATGSSPTPLRLRGADELAGRGISYCAMCDATLFRDREVALVLEDEWGLDEAKTVAACARRVYVFPQGPFDDSAVLDDTSLALLSNVEIVYGAVLLEATGLNSLEAIHYEIGGSTRSHSLSGLFGATKPRPNSTLLPTTIAVNKKGYAVVDDLGASIGVQNVYCIGELASEGRSASKALRSGHIAADEIVKQIADCEADHRSQPVTDRRSKDVQGRES